jgi:uncharacterized protein (TIGR03437 family)
MAKWIAFIAGLLIPAVSSTAQTINDFFDGGSLQDIHLTMSAGDWQSLHDQYLNKKAYYKCDFEWRGMVIHNTGLHTRGSGSLNPIKPGMAIEFGKYTSGQKFLGLDAVFFRNFAEDWSMLHERLAMQVFARMGLPYQRTSFSRLFVNGEYVGLYELLEPLDPRFIMTRFGEDTGYLYEAQGGEGFHFQYLGDDPKLYVPTLFDPKTHTDDPQGQVIADLVRTVNQASDADFVPAVSKYMDLGPFVAHVAVEVFLSEVDGILSDSGMANFYLYRRVADNRFFFLVWDKEMTFMLPDWPIWQYTQDNVLLRRALLVPELHKRYLDTLHLAAEVIGGPGGWLEGEIDREYKQIQQAAHEDPNRVCLVDAGLARCPEYLFEAGVDAVRGFARQRGGFVNGSLLADGWVQDSNVPDLTADAAVNAASGVAVLAPGEMAAIQANLPLDDAERPSSWPLPQELGGVSVVISGVKAPLILASPAGAWFQTPSELPSGPTSLTITDSRGASHTIPVEIRPANPGVFVVTHGDGSVVNAQSPAVAGETVAVWATGLGHAQSDELSGRAAPMDHLVEMKNAIAATVNGGPATVVWAGLAPGFAALQVVIVQVPAGLIGNQAVLALGILGEPSPGFLVAIH